MTTDVISPASRRFSATVFCLSVIAVSLLIALAAVAQTTATGSIIGRVYNPATKEYVKNAEVSVQGTAIATTTESDGAYQLGNVPAGPVIIEVRFTGYETATAKLNVGAGQTATHDFNIVTTGSTESKPGDDVLKLDAFVVNTEREGNAKAIMDQKRAMTVSNIVAAETFGNIAEGNVGEFVKYLPGIQMDMVEADARSPRIRGLPAQYTAVTFDGMSIASADGFIQNNGTDNGGGAGAGGRSFGFEQVSMSNVDAIEVNFTTTAADDAGAPAGTINLRSKHAYERSGQSISFDVSAMMNSEKLSLARSVGPDEKSRRKVFPNGNIEYANSFFNHRLGVIVSLNQSESYNEQHQFTPSYDTIPTATDTRPYVLTRIQYKDGPKYNERFTGSFTLDYSVNPNLRLALVGFINNYYAFVANRNFGVTSSSPLNLPVPSGSTAAQTAAINAQNAANNRQQIGGDGLTTWGSTPVSVTVTNTASYLLKRTHGYTYLPSFNYKKGKLHVDGATIFSVSENNYGGGESKVWPGNNVGGTSISSAGMKVNADRGSDLYSWKVTQVAGADWGDPTQYRAAATAMPTFGFDGRYNRSIVYQGRLDARYDTEFRIPTWFQVGGKITETTYIYRNPTSWQTWSYIGPGGGLGGSWSQYPSNYIVSPGHGASLLSTSGTTAAVVDHNAIGYLFESHPEYFTQGTSAANYLNSFVNQPKFVKEQTDATYAMMDVKPLKRLEILTGLRYERTRDLVKDFNPLGSAAVAAAFPGQVSATTGQATTIPAIQYQYFTLPRVARGNEYASFYPSWSAKYSIAHNLNALFGYSYTVTRPSYNDLAGVATENDTTLELSLPNIHLKPSYSQNYSGQVTYYFEPVGVLSAGFFENDFKNYVQSARLSGATAADAFGYADPFYDGYTVVTKVNLPGTVRYRGASLEYKQALSFLPKPFDGFDVFANYTRTYVAIKDVDTLTITGPNNLYNSGWLPGIAPNVVNAGVNYKWRRIAVGFKARWTDKMGTTSTPDTWMKANTKIDASASYGINERLTVYFSARNIFDVRDQTYIGTDKNRIGGGRAIEYYGAYLYFGLKGRF